MINNLLKSTLVVVHCALITVSVPNKDISQNKKVNSRLSEIMYYHGDSYVVVHYDNNTATFIHYNKLACTIPCAGRGVALQVTFILLYKGGDLLLYGR